MSSPELLFKLARAHLTDVDKSLKVVLDNQDLLSTTFSAPPGWTELLLAVASLAQAVDKMVIAGGEP